MNQPLAYARGCVKRWELKIRFFTRDECQLCDAAWFVVSRVARRFGATVERVDIDENGNEPWRKLYDHDIPVVHLDEREIFRHRVDEKALREMLEKRLKQGR